MSLAEDNQLMQRIARGDRAALRELFDRYFDDMARIAFRYLKDRAEAKDVAQEAFIKFWQKRQEIVIVKSLEAYLRTMVVNGALARIRSRKQTLDIEEAGLDRDESGDRTDGLLRENELRLRIANEVDKLPDKRGDIFRMSRYEGMSYKEIAEAMDISTKTVENQISQALRQLRVALREYLQIFF